MSWTTLQSAAHKKAAAITFKMSINKTGKGKFLISVPTTISTALGLDAQGIESCDVLWGNDEHAGSVWVKPAPDSAFKIGRLKHCCMLRVEPPQGVALGEFHAELGYVKHDDGGFVINLPQWAQAIPSDKNSGDKPGSLELSASALIYGGQEIRFTPTKMAALRVLVNSFGKVVSRDEIIKTSSPLGYAHDDLGILLGEIRSEFKKHGIALTIITHPDQGFEIRRAMT